MSIFAFLVSRILFLFSSIINWKLLTLTSPSIGDIAEKEGHHPDISFGWGYARIKIHTHAINGLAENDFILAAKIDKIINV